MSTGQGLIGYNMYAYCNNNPVMYADPCGTCLHRWDFLNDCSRCAGKNFSEKVSVLYDEWKDKSFVYNVGIKSITVYGGVGVGYGLPFEVVETSTYAEMGIKFEDGKWKTGEFGVKSAAVNLWGISLSYGNYGYTYLDDKSDPWETSFDVSLSVPMPSFAFAYSYHTEVSISLVSIVENFVLYGEKHWWG